MSKKSSRKSGSRKKCPHCKTGRETFRYMKRRFVFDVDRARELVSDGREPVEVEESSVRLTLEGCRIHAQHLRHVDTKYPGIIATVAVVTTAGERITGHVLIDGNHRATRCLQIGQPFFAYVLDEDETESVLKDRRPVVVGV